MVYAQICFVHKYGSLFSRTRGSGCGLTVSETKSVYGKEFVFCKICFENENRKIKGIVHFEIHFWYVLAYLKGSQDVGVFVSAVVSIRYFLVKPFVSISHIMEVYGEHAQRSPN